MSATLSPAATRCVYSIHPQPPHGALSRPAAKQADGALGLRPSARNADVYTNAYQPAAVASAVAAERPDDLGIAELRRRIGEHVQDATDFAFDCRRYSNEALRRYSYVPVRPYADASGKYRKPRLAPRSDLGRSIEQYRQAHPQALGSVTLDRSLLRIRGASILQQRETTQRELIRDVRASRRALLELSRKATGHVRSAKEIKHAHRDLLARLDEGAKQLDGATFQLTYRMTWRSYFRSLGAPLKSIARWLGIGGAC